ncbi:permease prefix domain 1-containing protein [Cryptosporangium sp. NPDC051539]|uniref:permease prefix domain 1-containing protein n=1 Tax=Cryptosporangium sp. NPDC051539 TaxID=3363962 RepID=UPI003790891F
MTVSNDSELEEQIAGWRAYVERRPSIHGGDADELEDHLRSRISELTDAGLTDDEAFLIAVKRMGTLDDVSLEFAREHSERLWKQLVLPSEPDAPTAARTRRELPVAVLCAVIAALAVKLPALFGLGLDGDEGFYARNLSLFVLVPLAGYFAWQRRVGPRVIAVLAGLFVLAAVFANAYPLDNDSQSVVLTGIHLPLALWLVVGVAYVGGDWLSGQRRMDFIRFTGEWAIYYVLLALGGGVLTAITVNVFSAIGVDADEFVGSWLVPCGAAGAVLVAAWLVESKQSVIENMAPVLTRVFTPLFAIALLVFLVAFVVSGHGLDVDRDVLILFNVLLVLVLGLLLYAISARDPLAKAGLFDRVQLGLVISALLIDALVLVAITGRITEFGFTPNKTAALGENLILLANLAWSAWLFVGFVGRRAPFARLERWQTSYLAVFAVWAWIVVVAFPPIFGFR